MEFETTGNYRSWEQEADIFTEPGPMQLYADNAELSDDDLADQETLEDYRYQAQRFSAYTDRDKEWFETGEEDNRRRAQTLINAQQYGSIYGPEYTLNDDNVENDVNITMEYGGPSHSAFDSFRESEYDNNEAITMEYDQRRQKNSNYSDQCRQFGEEKLWRRERQVDYLPGAIPHDIDKHKNDRLEMLNDDFLLSRDATNRNPREYAAGDTRLRYISNPGAAKEMMRETTYDDEYQPRTLQAENKVRVIKKNASKNIEGDANFANNLGDSINNINIVNTTYLRLKKRKNNKPRPTIVDNVEFENDDNKLYMAPTKFKIKYDGPKSMIHMKLKETLEDIETANKVNNIEEKVIKQKRYRSHDKPNYNVEPEDDEEKISIEKRRIKPDKEHYKKSLHAWDYDLHEECGYNKENNIDKKKIKKRLSRSIKLEYNIDDKTNLREDDINRKRKRNPLEKKRLLMEGAPGGEISHVEIEPVFVTRSKKKAALKANRVEPTYNIDTIDKHNSEMGMKIKPKNMEKFDVMNQHKINIADINLYDDDGYKENNIIIPRKRDRDFSRNSGYYQQTQREYVL